MNHTTISASYKIVVLFRKASNVTSGSDKRSLLQSRETFSSPCFPRVKQVVREKFSFEDEDENENHYTTPKLQYNNGIYFKSTCDKI
jgi:hypothetical protein